jgi:hypothetical protein
VDSAVHDAALLLPGNVILAVELREAPVVGLNDLLAASELELGAAKGFNCLQKWRMSAQLMGPKGIQARR